MKTYISTPPDNVKVYAALLTQTGTDAPTATVLKTTLGGTPELSYEGTGTFDLFLTGAFTGTPVLLESAIFNENSGVFNAIKGEKLDNDTFRLKTYAAADLTNFANDILATTLVNILVYP